MSKLQKLKEVLQRENEATYAKIGGAHHHHVSFQERLLARIEISVFGAADIQKKEFKKNMQKISSVKRRTKVL